jgi:hypothetical protein
MKIKREREWEKERESGRKRERKEYRQKKKEREREREREWEKESERERTRQKQRYSQILYLHIQWFRQHKISPTAQESFQIFLTDITSYTAYYTAESSFPENGGSFRASHQRHIIVHLGEKVK